MAREVKERFGVEAKIAGAWEDDARSADLVVQATPLGMKRGDEKVNNYLATGMKDIGGWKVGSLFGDAAFYHGDWLMRVPPEDAPYLPADKIAIEAQKQLELCLVRMPNQNVAVEDARKLLEFMRSNDGEK